MMESLLPVLPVAILILGSYCVPLFRRLAPALPSRMALVFTGAALVLGCLMLVLTAGGESLVYNVGGWLPPAGIEVRVAFPEAFMVATITAVGLLVLVWSGGGLSAEIHSRAIPWFYTMFLLTLAGMLGMAMAADLFNLYVFIEVTSIGACALAAARSDRRGTLASFEYLALATIGSGFILMGIGLTYMVTGNLNFAHVAMELRTVWTQYPNLLWVAASFYLVGFGVKGALFPLHVWLPNAHSSAPSPSSAVLSGLVVKVYAFGLIKVLHLVLVGATPAPTWASIRVIILLMAVAAIVGGSAFALVQSNVKRLLAYSTVAQIGYIFLGLGIGTPAGIAAGVFHILAHSLMKSCLFLAAGTMAGRTGAKEIADYDGMGRRMPLTMGAFAVGALSMVGIPGFAGLISKWQLALSAVDVGLPTLAGLMVLSGVLNALYYFPILERAYFRPPADQPAGEEGPPSMTAPLLVLAAGCIILGLVPGPVLDLLGRSLPPVF